MSREKGKSNSNWFLDRYKIIFLIVMVLLTSAVCYLGRVNAQDFEETIVKRTEDQMLVIAKVETVHIQRMIESIQTGLTLLSKEPTVMNALINDEFAQNPDLSDKYVPEIAIYKYLKNYVDAIYRINAKGIVQNRTPWKDRPPADYSKKPGVSAVLKDHKPIITDTFRTSSGKDCISVCCPVFDSNRFVGVLRAVVYLDTFRKCLEDCRISENGYAFMIDSQGKVASHPSDKVIGVDPVEYLQGLFPAQDFSSFQTVVQEMVAGKQGNSTFDAIWVDDQEPKIVRKLCAYSSVEIEGKVWSIAVVIGYDEIAAPILAHNRNIYLGVGLAVLIMLAAGICFSVMYRRTTRLKLQAQSAEQLKQINSYLQSQIEERKIAEARLIQLNKQLEASIEKANLMAKETALANESKSEFPANMSHEIRTPLNSIIGFSEVLGQESLTPEQLKYIEMIIASGSNLMQVVNDILDFSKIKAGKLETEMIKFSLREFLDDIDILLRFTAVEKNLDFNMIYCDDLPENVITDPARLRQCLINLIGNAIKFTEKGHVSLNVSLSGKQDGKVMIKFEIEDSGIGIDPENQNRIFNSFSQADEGTSRKFGGTGLGLAITKQLTELLNGNISVSSKHGKGTVFTLMIPVDVVKSKVH